MDNRTYIGTLFSIEHTEIETKVYVNEENHDYVSKANRK